MTTERLPVLEPSFWRDRVKDAIREGPANIHKAVYNISDEVWNTIQAVHGEVLSRLFNPYKIHNVLDAGCGYGALIPLLPERIQYTGVDISPDLIRLAKEMHGVAAHPVTFSSLRYKFYVGDLRNLSRFGNKQFDTAICRSVRGMIIAHVGQSTWREIEKELLRVADRLIVMEYGEPNIYRVHDATQDCKEYISSTIETDNGRLVYRVGKDGTIELYDLFVSEEHRRKGVASKLVNMLVEDARITGGCLYGFTQLDNHIIHSLYSKLGFDLVRVPGFYRGVDAIMVVKSCYPKDAERAYPAL